MVDEALVRLARALVFSQPDFLLRRSRRRCAFLCAFGALFVHPLQVIQLFEVVGDHRLQFEERQILAGGHTPYEQ